MARVALILGGARSGKSRYGESLALGSGLEPVYLATSRIDDAEMRERVKRHRDRRSGQGWHLVEEPIELACAIRRAASRRTVILVDCLSMWLSNLMLAEREIGPATDGLLRALDEVEGQVVLVSSEVGLGVVPATPLGRRFRDGAGELHQGVARMAETVVLMVAGLPVVAKAPGRGSAGGQQPAG